VKQASMTRILVSAIFISLLALPLLFIQWSEEEYSNEEKRVLAAAPSFWLEDYTWNPNVGGEIKSWLEDHIGFRSKLVRLYAETKFRFFRQSPSEKVHIGKEGWYYYTQDENLEIALGTYTLTPDVLEQILYRHLAIRDKLQAKGIDYVIILPTSKVSIYPEYLRCGSGEVRQTPADIVADYLEGHSDLKVIRLKDALLRSKKEHQVFFKTDTHWTQPGAFAAYQEIIRKLQEWGYCGTRPIDVAFENAEYCGEFSGMMGLDLPPEAIENIVILDKKAVLNPETEQYARFREAVEAAANQNPCYYYSNPAVEGPSVLMFGDSMFGGWQATELLAENFPEFSYYWGTDMQENVLDAVMPDLVFYELTERYLNVFPLKNSGFLQTPLSDFQAKLISYEWDGSKLTATFKNTSDSVWKNIDMVRLGIFDGEKDTGLRASLPVSQEIMPGEEFTFSFSFEQMSEQLPSKLEIQMLQEGICYFGDKQAVTEQEFVNGDVVLSQRLSRLPEAPAQTADYWIGTQGLCIDTCNGGQSAERMMIQPDAQQVELVGWAADFDALQPLSALYLQVGEHVIPCNYGLERVSVSDYFGNENLRNTGFTVTFPAAYVEENATGTIAFIPVSADGAYRYEPIEFGLAFPPTPLADFQSEPLSACKNGSWIELTVKNTSQSVWTEKNMVRAGVFSNGQDTGLRGYLQPDKAVKPGETVIFRISLEGHEALFTTVLEATMLQESISYFGKRILLPM